jgi:hypothetical protein
MVCFGKVALSVFIAMSAIWEMVGKTKVSTTTPKKSDKKPFKWAQTLSHFQ